MLESQLRRLRKSLKDQKRADEVDRGEDAQMRKLKAQLSQKFGELKGGIG
jgi:hypothetical protein